MIENVAYSRDDVQNLLFNLIEPKLQKLMDSVLKTSPETFLGLLNIPSDPDTHHDLKKSALEHFDWLIMDLEFLQTEFYQKKLFKDSAEIERFCKSLLSFDLIASEIVRIASVFGLNQKFQDYEDE